MLMDMNIIAAEVECHGSSSESIVPVSHEVRTFDLPRSIWITMFLSYAIFFGGLVLATGHDGITIFMIVISAAYAVMYFGTAAVLNAVNAAERPKLRTSGLQTLTGPMTYGAVFAQVLTVPILLAGFACVIAVICAVVMP